MSKNSSNQISTNSKATWFDVAKFGWAASKSVTALGVTGIKIGNEKATEYSIEKLQQVEAAAVGKNNEWCEAAGLDRKREASVRVVVDKKKAGKPQAQAVAAPAAEPQALTHDNALIFEAMADRMDRQDAAIEAIRADGAAQRRDMADLKAMFASFMQQKAA